MELGFLIDDAHALGEFGFSFEAPRAPLGAPTLVVLGLAQGAGLPIDGLVARYTADVTATNAISANLETRGVLGRPFTVVHTTDDPLIPYWHATVHQSKVLANSTIDPAINPYRLVTVPAYGHCAFPATPVLLAFDELIGKIDTHELYLPLVAQ